MDPGSPGWCPSRSGPVPPSGAQGRRDLVAAIMIAAAYPGKGHRVGQAEWRSGSWWPLPSPEVGGEHRCRAGHGERQGDGQGWRAPGRKHRKPGRGYLPGFGEGCLACRSRRVQYRAADRRVAKVFGAEHWQSTRVLSARGRPVLSAAGTVRSRGGVPGIPQRQAGDPEVGQVTGHAGARRGGTTTDDADDTDEDEGGRESGEGPRLIREQGPEAGQARVHRQGPRGSRLGHRERWWGGPVRSRLDRPLL